MTPITALVGRESFGSWLDKNGFRGTGVEIGTFRGEYAKQICAHWSGKLITVDPYNWNNAQGYRDGCVIDWTKTEPAKLSPRAIHDEAATLLAKVPNCQMIRMESLTAAQGVENDTLDFVYLDGNHSRESVWADVNAWMPKIRQGGILAGHDCYCRYDQYQDCGVFDVVWNLAKSLNQKPHVTHCSSWWFQL